MFLHTYFHNNDGHILHKDYCVGVSYYEFIGGTFIIVSVQLYTEIIIASEASFLVRSMALNFAIYIYNIISG